VILEPIVSTTLISCAKLISHHDPLLGPQDLPENSTDDLADAPTQEDTTSLDDGDPECDAANLDLLRESDRTAKAPASLPCYQAQNGDDGALGPPPPELQNQPEEPSHGWLERRWFGSPCRQTRFRELGLCPAQPRGYQGHRGRRIHRRASSQRGPLHSGT
jgi:hypothetical protein